MKIIVDIDGTIAETVGSDYQNSKPIQNNIDKINRLYDLGNEIVYFTARGANSGIDWTELTAQQLHYWGAKHSELRMGKLSYDLFVDDKCTTIENLIV